MSEFSLRGSLEPFAQGWLSNLSSESDRQGTDFAEAFTALWRDECTIRSVEQLEVLPVGAVVIDLGAFDVFYAVSRPEPQVPAWVQPGYAYRATADEVPLPVLLVWIPGWSA